ncbi:hypothetical protein KQI49_16835 [Virgibacillus sp. MSJ-26]|uniref:hypothetical protein n=1 Tax=Virgibacillus sp. MSJ-26 TaxID=2841522 RepID=UPI001C10B2DB|nr:hypothetical protein [Virgibacillus sp. MSJ-26]MBU5468491.1 hypothetical protein [Virgibacillus sp. MSJ-26]
MGQEEKIISMLEQIIGKQDEHSGMLNEHRSILNEHTSILKEQSNILNEHSQKHNQHTEQFKEHGQILSALQTGQEHLKAELEGMKKSNKSEFKEVKEQLSNVSTKEDLLQKDVWNNKVDIERLKNIIGIS